jgi:chorismate dehydratase
MEKIRISAVRYANTYPFIYGLSEGGFETRAIIETDHPTECASKLITGRADIGLIPVAALPQLKESHIISDYCIGANGKVRTVQLMSNNRFGDISRVYLDYRSRTSVNLVKVLARYKWNRTLEWTATSEDFDFTARKKGEAVVLIGDQCFEYENAFRLRIDLAEEWKDFSGLPFVFACWASNRVIEAAFMDEFNSALKNGVENIDKVVERFGSSGTIRGTELKEYLETNIDFHLNQEKKQGMDLFLKLLKTL